MAHAVFYCSFKLKQGASVADFLQAAKNLNDLYISKQPGYLSWKQLVAGDTWADVITFETMDDLKRFVDNSGKAGEWAEQFYAFLNLNSCQQHDFMVERSYE